MTPPPENAHVKAERAHQRAMFTGGINSGADVELTRFDYGELVGADDDPNQLQPWAFSILSKLTAWQRGYLLGVLLSEDERYLETQGRGE